MLRERVKKVHFVGIGGIGMSGIARILLGMGYSVSGSDLKDSETTRSLRGMGAKIYTGHSGDNVSSDVQVVVYSSAVKKTNPELLKARELGIPVISRGEMLAELFKLKEGIAVSGSHGKTTTTSMIAHVLEEGGLDPTVIIGGVLQRLGSNAKLGSGELLVSEADESDGSFLKLSPAVAVVTNIDREHLDFYGDLEGLVGAFARFVDSVPFYGFCVANADCTNTKKAVSETTKRVITFGMSKEATVVGENLRLSGKGYSFSVIYKGHELGDIHLSIGGRHNVYNALATVAVAMELGVSFETVKRALESFRNARRRMELKGFIKGVPVYDDYGHHPTEMRMVIQTLKEMYPRRRLVVVFQPHRYSRTYMLFEEFATVLALPERVFLLDIFPAGETNPWGVEAEELARRAGAVFIESKEELGDALLGELRDGDVLLFMGAGDINKLCDDFLQITEEKLLPRR
ncbi:MAG TPA: UDP-N-acetylmuramate--L-alanine ligase [Aquifex aeolicus]|nr:UDP-N-acetylmuramate--L-alanine ligase [Aquifex aeolicus]